MGETRVRATDLATPRRAGTERASLRRLLRGRTRTVSQLVLVPAKVAQEELRLNRLAAEQLDHRLHVLLGRGVTFFRRHHLEGAFLFGDGWRLKGLVVVIVVIVFIVELFRVVHVVAVIRHGAAGLA